MANCRKGEITMSEVKMTREEIYSKLSEKIQEELDRIRNDYEFGVIENEKIDEFGKVYKKFKVESEKFLTLKSKKKREESVKEKIKALDKLASSLKKLVKEVAEMKRRAEKQRDNEMNTKIFN